MTPDLFNFTPPARYPDAPGAKRQETSFAAAADMAPRAPKLRDRVLDAIRASGHNGLTADEAAGRLGLSILSVRPRLSELVDTQRIRDTGMRRRNDSGKRAIVWQAL